MKKKARKDNNRDLETMMEYIRQTWSVATSGLPTVQIDEAVLSHDIRHYKGFLPLDHLVKFIESEDDKEE